MREYWIADPEAESVEQYLLSDDEYQLAGKFTDAQIIGSEVISGLGFPVDVLFDQQAARAFYRRDAAM